MIPILFNCGTHIVCTSKCVALRPGPSLCIMALALLLSVQTSILNGRAVWCSSKCFTHNASMQPFVIALATDSAEDSDTVACVTDHCRTVKHGPIVNTPPNVKRLIFGSPAQKEIQYTSLTSSEVMRNSLQFCLLRLWSVLLPLSFFLCTEGNVEALFCHLLTDSST